VSESPPELAEEDNPQVARRVTVPLGGPAWRSPDIPLILLFLLMAKGE
jgi:hypothetical protein